MEFYFIKMELYLYSLLSPIPGLLSAQLVNIESKRMQIDSVRFALKADFSFDHSSNDKTQVNQVDAALTTQLKSKDLRKIWLITVEPDLVREINLH